MSGNASSGVWLDISIMMWGSHDMGQIAEATCKMHPIIA